MSLPINYVLRGCGNESWVDELTDAYLEKGDYNVIVVDYSGPDGDYNPTKVKEIKKIGKRLGVFIDEVYGNCGGNLSDVHIIGYDVGAQIAAFAGQKVKKLSEESVGRITGLDAALHNFLKVGKDERLSKDDAEIVVAIHTDGAVHGFLEPIGLIDFYPNGGKLPQPGCGIFDLSNKLCSKIRY